MNVIILAAGFGRRLQELTENTPNLAKSADKIEGAITLVFI